MSQGGGFPDSFGESEGGFLDSFGESGGQVP